MNPQAVHFNQLPTAMSNLIPDENDVIFLNDYDQNVELWWNELIEEKKRPSLYFGKVIVCVALKSFILFMYIFLYIYIYVLNTCGKW